MLCNKEGGQWKEKLISRGKQSLDRAINHVAKFSNQACMKGSNNTPVYKENSFKF